MVYKIVNYFGGVRTKDDLNCLLEELEELNSSVYRLGDQSFEKVLESKVRIITANILREIINQDGLVGNNEGIGELIRNLIDSVKELEIVNITLGIEPTDNIKQQIINWIKLNVKLGVIAEFSYKPEIIAGVIVSYQGNYYNYSWSKHWDTIWKQVKKDLNYGEQI